MKPDYHFFNNTFYALNGIKTLWQNEKSFRLEILIVFPFFILSFILPFPFLNQIFLCFVLFLVLLTEAINSAIEYTVDLNTTEFHILAKKAKDCASAAVFFSICNASFCWIVHLIYFCLNLN